MYYGHFSQMGSKGFFGPFDRDSSAANQFSSLNGWMGNQLGETGALVSGSTVVVNTTALSVTPRIGNEWIQIHGRYLINAYDAGSSPGSFVAVSPALLTTYGIDITTPLATVGYGKRPFYRGMGLQFAFDRTEEYFFLERSIPVPNLLWRLISVGILPRTAMSWFNPLSWTRHRSDPEDAKETWYNIPVKSSDYYVNSAGNGYITFGIGAALRETVPLPFSRDTSTSFRIFNPRDANALVTQNYLAYISYYSKDLVIGIGGTHLRYHFGPEIAASAALKITTPAVDSDQTEAWLNLQYGNGTFFLKSELDWFSRSVKYQRSLNGNFLTLTPAAYADGSGRQLFAPIYDESWRFVIESGFYHENLSFRALYAFLPGPDRRHGIRIDHQPFIQENEQKAAGVFDPYSILLAYRYGGGVNADGYINDATVLAAKIDCAIAANLLLDVAVLTAKRNSHGYGWGYIRPNPSAYGFVEYAIRGNFNVPSPAIPDNDLGWEYSAGFVWGLLDGWNVAGRAAYWQPGNWFKYACIDRSLANWHAPSAGNNFGANPDRAIDPIVGFELQIGASF